MPGHLLDAVKRRLQELAVDLDHQRQVLLALALRLAVKARPDNRQQPALFDDRQLFNGPAKSWPASLAGPWLELSGH